MILAEENEVLLVKVGAKYAGLMVLYYFRTQEVKQLTTHY